MLLKFNRDNKHAQIAQSVEQRTENPCVTGSIPVLGIIFLLFGRLAMAFGTRFSDSKEDGLLAQAVEHLTFNQGVAGSSPAWLRRSKDRRALLSFFLNKRVWWNWQTRQI